MVSLEALEALQKTREFAELKDSDSAITVPVPRPKRPPIGKIRLPIQRKKVYTGLALLSIAVIGFTSFTLSPIGSKTKVHTEKISTTSIPPSTATKNDRFMTMRPVGGGSEQAMWMVSTIPNSDTLTLSGFSPTSLTRLTARPDGNGDWTLSGGWAAYILPQAGSMQFGDAQGTLHWPGGNANMHVHLKHIRERDGETVQLTLAGTSAPSMYNRETFLRAFESKTHLQTLLYTELLPRRLKWGLELESLLPALRDSRYFIPFANGDITIDGVLDEELWKQRHYRPNIGPVGELASHSGQAKAILQARWNSDSFFLASRIESRATNAQLEISVLPAFEISTRDSARFLLRVDQFGETHFRYFLGPVEQQAIFVWPVTVEHQSDTRTVEMKIPLERLNESARPRNSKRWRLNAQWFHEDDTGNRTILAQWGDENVMALSHGALVIFDGARNQ